jgi:sarcosine oxidase subunit delta
MRITCPHCGERSLEEFSYLGDATVVRPEGESAEVLAKWVEYVYLRENPVASHREYWYHASGCHAWLVVTRDLKTHAIEAVEDAKPLALKRRAGGRS